jgi:penicillin V acylase-like amidase (Ntn superfamily)
MDSVSIPRGVVKNSQGKDHYTLYTSCADMDDLIYYFSTRNSRSISGVKLSHELTDSDRLALAEIYRSPSAEFIVPMSKI